MKTYATRRALVASLGIATLAGCLGGGRSGNSEDGGTETSTGGETTTTDQPKGEETGPPTADERLPLPMEPSEIKDSAVSGGPPKDAIPSIDNPAFVSAKEASTWLDSGDPVFGLEQGGEVKAYPQSILVLHEICNDVVDGKSVSVTYCPLTGTAMGFERGETTFGVSGRLVNNNLIMYDRAMETWWPQVLATAVPGPWNEEPSVQSLQEFRLIWTTWERWSDAHPDTQVLSRQTGYARNYDSDPYGSYNPRSGYYLPEQSPMFNSLSEDDRLQPKTVVIGSRTGEGAVAFEKQTLSEENLIQGEIGGQTVLATYEPELDTGYVYRNPDEKQYSYRDGKAVDQAGETYPPDALPMERILAFDAMWFAWGGFYPDTTLYA